MKYLCVDYWYIVQQLKDDILTVTKKGPLYCLLEIETKCSLFNPGPGFCHFQDSVRLSGHWLSD